MRLLASLALLLVALALPARAADPANTVIMTLKTGTVEIELYPAVAPEHVARIKQLVGEHFYDGVKFHRVIEGFMAQTGDPTGTGRGGSSYPDLPAEFSDTPFQRGTLGMARTANPNSANSQFFICFTDDSCAHLAGQYTVFGRVVSGMEAIDQVKRGSGQGGMVQNPDQIITMRMAGEQ
ncbi:MAG: peptidylprolyl isomerase [Hyphomicrobiaceae bacterium]